MVTNPTTASVVLDSAVRLAVFAAGVSLSEKMIRAAFGEMKKDMPDRYANPELAMEELEKMEAAVLMFNRALHRD